MRVRIHMGCYGALHNSVLVHTSEMSALGQFLTFIARAELVRLVPTADISRSGSPEGTPLAVALSRIGCRSAKAVWFRFRPRP